MKVDKQELILKCQELIKDRLLLIQQNMAYAQKSANEETKSSAGDKYETGRAIAQMERDKGAVQLAEVLKLKKVIDQINPGSKAKVVGLGSIVYTDQGVFLIAVSLGAIEIENVKIISISPISPLGQKFIKRTAGDLVIFNDTKYSILEVS